MLRFNLRAKILFAVLAAVIATDALGTWAVNDRLLTGAQQEGDRQAQAQMAQTRALYAERAATLAAEGEAVALYPAVIAALVDNNPKPLLQWSGQVASLQSTRVTVVDAAGRVVARGHAPDQAGDDLAMSLAGMRIALAGQSARGTEAGDEIGLAVRGYAPVRKNGLDGPVVGAVMMADPLAGPLLSRLNPGPDDGTATGLNVVAGVASGDGPACAASGEAAITACHFPLLAPDGRPSATLALTVPLAEIERARANAQQALWLVGGLVLVVGAVAAWLLARSLSGPLARLTAAAGQIAAGAYDRPLDERSRDEIGVLARAFEAMRRQVAAATTRLRDERDVLDAVLESTGDGVLMADQAGQPVVENRRWAELLGGRGLAAAAGLRRLEGSHQQLFGAAAQAWLLDPERVIAAEFEKAEPNSSYQRFRCYTAPVRHLDHTTIGRLFVLRDITRESEAERMRNAFVATVSHELRSPLTAIAGYTDTLLHSGPWDPATEREFLEIVARSASKLAGLVDNLLDTAKVEAGVLRLECEPVRVERIAEQVVGQRRALAPLHALHVEVQPGLPLVTADPLRVEQVLANLVDNAIKYSPDGGPITIRVAHGANGLTIGVSDRGVGVSAEQAERLFDRFYRADSSLRRTTPGVGLGLFICRSLVEAHGGHIWIDSQPGQGSTFWFTLPTLEDLSEGAPPTASIDAAAVGVRSRREVLA